MNAKDQRIQELERIVIAQAAQIEMLLARIAELERRLALNSSNSSKPPSSDGLRKASKNRSLRETDNKKFGGQIGHKGDTLKPTITPDIIQEHNTEACVACGDSLQDIAVTETIVRQETDVVVQKVVTEHRALVKICRCGTKNTGTMPEQMKAPVQYSANVRALAVYLTNQFISKDRISRMFEDLFQLPISDTTLIGFDEECAEKLVIFNEKILEIIKNDIVKHLDETGMRVAGKTHWVHVISTTLLTHYRINPKRGDLLQGIINKIVHDHWKPYFTLEDVIHVLCNAHHLRELRALIELDEESWALEMYSLLKDASQLKNPSPEQQQEISSRYDQIVAAGLNYHEALGPFKLNSRKRRTGHNLALRLLNFKTEVLRFLYDSDVPFTNNQAERDLRMIKLKQKVSGCFRTFEGAQIFMAIRSFVSTVQKQNKNVFKYLSDLFNNQLDLSSLVPS